MSLSVTNTSVNSEQNPGKNEAGCSLVWVASRTAIDAKKSFVCMWYESPFPSYVSLGTEAGWPPHIISIDVPRRDEGDGERGKKKIWDGGKTRLILVVQNIEEKWVHFYPLHIVAVLVSHFQVQGCDSTHEVQSRAAIQRPQQGGQNHFRHLDRLFGPRLANCHGVKLNAISLSKLYSFSYNNANGVWDPTAESAPECKLYDANFIIYSSVASFYIPCVVIILLYYRIMKVK